MRTGPRRSGRRCAEATSSSSSAQARLRSWVKRSTFVIVEYEDRVTIETPEGLDLELTLAGVGSRFASALIDVTIQLALLVALGLVLGVGAGVSPDAGGFGVALYAVLSFLLFV